MATIDPAKVNAALAARFGGGGAGAGGGAKPTPGHPEPTHGPVVPYRPGPIEVSGGPVYTRAQLEAIRANAARMTPMAEAEKQTILSMVKQIIGLAKSKGGEYVTRLRNYVKTLDPRIVAAIMTSALAADLYELGVFSSNDGAAGGGADNGSGGGFSPPPMGDVAPPPFGGSGAGAYAPSGAMAVVIQIADNRYQLQAPRSVTSANSIALSTDYFVQPVELISDAASRRFVQQMCAPFGGPRRVAQLIALIQMGFTPEILATLDDM